MLKLRSVRAALIAGVLTLTTVDAASADGYSRSLNAHNYKGSTVVDLYFKPTDYSDWTAITGERIAPGTSEHIDVTGFPGRCMFDIEAEFADGSSSSGTFNLCYLTDVNV